MFTLETQLVFTTRSLFCSFGFVLFFFWKADIPEFRSHPRAAVDSPAHPLPPPPLPRPICHISSRRRRASPRRSPNEDALSGCRALTAGAPPPRQPVAVPRRPSVICRPAPLPPGTVATAADGRARWEPSLPRRVRSQNRHALPCPVPTDNIICLVMSCN